MKTDIRVLHINNTDVLGGRFNGYSLSFELPRVGVQSRMAVMYKRSQESFVWQIFEKGRYHRLNGLLLRIERILALQSVLVWGAWGLLVDRRLRWASVFHLHLIHNEFFSLLALPILTRVRPTVWSIHDTWALTGRCIQPFACDGWKNRCGICPTLRTPLEMIWDNSRFMLCLKKWIYKISKFEIIVASKKMQAMVEESPLLSSRRTHLIPFGIDQKIFKPTDREAARKRLGVFPGSLVLSFRLNNGEIKGGPYLLEALRNLKHEGPICLIAMEARGMLDEFRGRFQIIEVGWLYKDADLVDVLNAADVFVMPSVAEAFGMMAVEAMACGAPVVVFEGSALPWVVDAPRVGSSVPSRDAKALGECLDELLAKSELRKEKSLRGLELVGERYSLQGYLEKLESTYTGAVERLNS